MFECSVKPVLTNFKLMSYMLLIVVELFWQFSNQIYWAVKTDLKNYSIHNKELNTIFIIFTRKVVIFENILGGFFVDKMWGECWTNPNANNIHWNVKKQVTITQVE